MQNTNYFERYRLLLDDWASFQTTLNQPLPTCIWTNTLRILPQQLADIFAADGLILEPFSWYPGGFKVPANFKPGRHWAYWAGLYQIQEEVSMLPTVFLDPQPYEHVLDLCAAPGNKTAQIAVQMHNQGTVVCNDINTGRMRAVRQTLERLGLVNVTTVSADGANYPKAAGLFDKVLVDVPCSCEGTSRKDPAVLGRARTGFLGKRGGLQVALLQKAVQRCKPGGRIVYATCTYAPEENERVVDAVLTHYGLHTVQLRPVNLPNLKTAPGLTTWGDQSFQPSLAHTMRIWPHHNDTGGFYVAVIEKLAQADPPALSDNFIETDRTPDQIVPPEIMTMLADDFGLTAQIFDSYHLTRQSRKKIYITAKTHQPPQIPAPDAQGMIFINTGTRYPKLSTAAAQLLGPHATRNFINVTRSQLDAYLRRQVMTISATQTRHCTRAGYVLVKYEGYVLGVGMYQPNEFGGVVASLFPKSWSLGRP